jgi:hypothetical protein
MSVIKGSRPTIRRGDVFIFQIPKGSYRFGLVVGADLQKPETPWVGAHLVYLYDYEAPEVPSAPRSLSLDHLLTAPLFVGRANWTRGYFLTIGHHEIESDDLLSSSCFMVRRGIYCDERGRALASRSEPCGLWGLWGIPGIDEELSERLGLDSPE